MLTHKVALLALSALSSMLGTLPDPVAVGYTTYALRHQVVPCGGTWPNGITPTREEAAVFYAGCNLLNGPQFSKEEAAWVLVRLP